MIWNLTVFVTGVSMQEQSVLRSSPPICSHLVQAWQTASHELVLVVVVVLGVVVGEVVDFDVVVELGMVVLVVMVDDVVLLVVVDVVVMGLVVVLAVVDDVVLLLKVVEDILVLVFDFVDFGGRQICSTVSQTNPAQHGLFLHFSYNALHFSVVVGVAEVDAVEEVLEQVVEGLDGIVGDVED